MEGAISVLVVSTLVYHFELGFCHVIDGYIAFVDAGMPWHQLRCDISSHLVSGEVLADQDPGFQLKRLKILTPGDSTPKDVHKV